jgi:D-amino-acid dehydrogenase
MRILVLGSGVVGVTTAYELTADGHEVLVLDRQAEAGMETSYANAGLIAPGHVYAWASPRAPRILLQSLWRSDAALKFRLRADPQLWQWGLRFLANCTTARNRANTLRKLSLCLYSQRRLAEVARDSGVAYDAIRAGILYLYRDPAHFETGVANMRLLQEHGLELEAIDAARIIALEPALGLAQGKFVGAIFAPKDESGDCLKFTQGLAATAARQGAEFRMAHEVQALEREGERITGILTDKGRLQGDAYVLAMGSYSPRLARPLGLDLPIYPVKGYSLTLPLLDAQAAPEIGGVDEAHLVAFARLGDRLRLTATADFAGYDTSYEAGHFATMLRVARELFPHAAAYDKPDYWACLRPMTPDGPPILGRCRFTNLYLNTGQGHMGWTMAAGCSRIVADLIAGRAPAIDITGLTLDRY